MKKNVNDKQCTILWHVESLQMSHVDPDIVSSVLADIDAEYGKIAKMTITRGKIHKYLGISSPVEVIFSTVDYIRNILDYILEYMKGGSVTTASHHIFDIVLDATKLSCTNTYIFHNFVAQL